MITRREVVPAPVLFSFPSGVSLWVAVCWSVAVSQGLQAQSSFLSSSVFAADIVRVGAQSFVCDLGLQAGLCQLYLAGVSVVLGRS